jgi:hypothetical protein
MGLLDAQRHRRFIKTHTPLDGLPLAAGVHYVTVGRDPLDVAVSFDHHRANLDREVFEALQARAPEPTSSSRPAIGAEVGGPAGQRERLLQWIRDERPPAGNLDSLRAVVRHLGDAWARRPDPAFTLVHYNDLSRRLDQQMRGLAARLDITVAEDRWPGLAQAATFGRMRARADDLVPDERLGLFADRDKFFRSGTSRQWRTTLTDQDLEDYRRLLRSLTSPEIVAWLEYGDSGAAE